MLFFPDDKPIIDIVDIGWSSIYSHAVPCTIKVFILSGAFKDHPVEITVMLVSAHLQLHQEFTGAVCTCEALDDMKIYSLDGMEARCPEDNIHGVTARTDDAGIHGRTCSGV